MERAVEENSAELDQRVIELGANEGCSRRSGCAAHEYDLEMMQEVGYCSGIENYSPPRRPQAR